MEYNWFNYDDANNAQINLSEDYISEIIKELKTITNGKVNGAYKEITYTKAGYNAAIASIQKEFDLHNKLFKNLFFHEEEDKTVEVPDEISKKRDINVSNGLKVYKFEIYNDSYRFRVFKLVGSLAYPVGIVLDDGIAEELGMKSAGKEIASNTEMERFLHQIIGTQKFRNVVNQMKVLIELENDDKIMDYITNNGGSTLADIASAIGWTQKLTKERLNKLEEEKRISIKEEGNKAKIYKLVTPENYNQ